MCLIEFACVFVIVCDHIYLFAILAVVGPVGRAAKQGCGQRGVHVRGSDKLRGDSAVARGPTNKNFWRAHRYVHWRRFACLLVCARARACVCVCVCVLVRVCVCSCVLVHERVCVHAS